MSLALWQKRKTWRIDFSAFEGLSAIHKWNILKDRSIPCSWCSIKVLMGEQYEVTLLVNMWSIRARLRELKVCAGVIAQWWVLACMYNALDLIPGTRYSFMCLKVYINWQILKISILLPSLTTTIQSQDLQCCKERMYYSLFFSMCVHMHTWVNKTQ